MTASLILHSGAWLVSDIIDGHLVTHRYYGHTKAQAKRLFRQQFHKKPSTRKRK